MTDAPVGDLNNLIATKPPQPLIGRKGDHQHCNSLQPGPKPCLPPLMIRVQIWLLKDLPHISSSHPSNHPVTLNGVTFIRKLLRKMTGSEELERLARSRNVTKQIRSRTSEVSAVVRTLPGVKSH
jgi:hypothetical protein